MKHSTWAVTSRITKKTDAGKIVKLESINPLEVWIDNETYAIRYFIVAVDEDNRPEPMEEVLIGRGEYAIHQMYDVVNKSRKAEEPKMLAKFAQVIPAYGDVRTHAVNTLQYLVDGLMTRMLVSGTPLGQFDGWKKSTTPGGYELRNWVDPKGTPVVGSFEHSTTMRILLDRSGLIDRIEDVNTYDNKTSYVYSNFKYMKDEIVGFQISSELSQAMSLLMPREEITFARVRIDGDSNVPKIAPNSTVFDFRLCKPVLLNKFPDKHCLPKTYKWKGDLLPLDELSSVSMAPFRNEVQKESGDWTLLSVGIVIILLGLFIAFRFFRKK